MDIYIMVNTILERLNIDMPADQFDPFDPIANLDFCHMASAFADRLNVDASNKPLPPDKRPLMDRLYSTILIIQVGKVRFSLKG